VILTALLALPFDDAIPDVGTVGGHHALVTVHDSLVTVHDSLVTAHDPLVAGCDRFGGPVGVDISLARIVVSVSRVSWSCHADSSSSGAASARFSRRVLEIYACLRRGRRGLTCG
jgi:hypothetical protein